MYNKRTMKDIFFVTQNSYKFEKFKESIADTDILLEQFSAKTPEIQADNNLEIAKFSAKWAADNYHKQVVCEDVGLYIEIFNGFPGPFLSYAEKQLKTEGFLKLMQGIENRRAYWEYSVAYCEPGGEPVGFSTKQLGALSTQARGTSGWFVDKLFIPDGSTKTVAELLDEGSYIRNSSHYQQLIDYINIR